MAQQIAPKILFIDDSDEITELISKFLRLKNYDVTTTNDGKNGILLLLNQKFDVILLDISMPRFSGFDVIDSLVKHGRIKDQKIILLTAVNLSQEEIDGLLALGVSKSLLKPVEMDVLINTINHSLNQDSFVSDKNMSIVTKIKYKNLFDESSSYNIKELEQQKLILKALNEYLTNEIPSSDKFKTLVDELKNLMTPTTAYLDMLIAGHFGDLSYKQKKILEIIKESVSAVNDSFKNKSNYIK
jgi:DNA-binding response OmpR family regulator